MTSVIGNMLTVKVMNGSFNMEEAKTQLEEANRQMEELQAKIAAGDFSDFSGFSGGNGGGVRTRDGEVAVESVEIGEDSGEAGEVPGEIAGSGDMIPGGEFSGEFPGSGGMFPDGEFPREFSGSGGMFPDGEFPGGGDFAAAQESIYTGEEREVIIPIGIPIMKVAFDMDTAEAASTDAGNSDAGNSGNTNITAMKFSVTEKEAELTDIKVGSIVNIEYDETGEYIKLATILPDSGGAGGFGGMGSFAGAFGGSFGGGFGGRAGRAGGVGEIRRAGVVGGGGVIAIG
ncbi:hypothetical protein FACS189499_08920 [Clostridia bacterium]|nr:hypothetical protein FACS189499_08920 [Clostridia bacterium]